MMKTLTKFQFFGFLIGLLIFPQIVTAQVSYAIERAHKMTSYTK